VRAILPALPSERIVAFRHARRNFAQLVLPARSRACGLSVSCWTQPEGMVAPAQRWYEVEFTVPDIPVDGKRSPYAGGVFRVRTPYANEPIHALGHCF
jgi:hypothetical protein